MNLKTHLSTKTKDDLIREILTLANTFPAVNDYYANMFGKSDEVAAKFKKKIKDEFFPARGDGHARAGVVRGIIAAFKRVSASKRDLADLYIYHVEQGVKFTNEYGDINESFYNSIESSFEYAMKLIKKEKLLEEFQQRCAKIVGDSEDTGWGFGEFLADEYYSVYGDNPGPH